VEPKPNEYYDVDRSEFLRWVDAVPGRVLEIGCGTGRNAEQFRSAGATEIVGVELDPQAAATAAERFDIVFAEPIETALAKIHGPFDLIVCADVLEHLVDPWTILTQLRTFAAPDTTLAVSIPNVRQYRVLWDIAFGRGFHYPLDGSYDPHSIFDTTHLRFFTRANIADSLTHTGWVPDRWGVPPARRLARVRPIIDALSRGSASQWLTYQWYVAAHPTEKTPDDRD
jgi:SAM-dependent methyltransferase